MAIECTYCEEKINAKRGIFIKCTTCQDINLCLECFSAGAIIANHENDHPYELKDCGSFSILDETWKAYEELALLEAIELYGIGSWTDIANAVETRTAEECRNRYLTVYVDNFFGRRTWDAVERDLYRVYDHTCTYNQPLSPSLSLPEKHKTIDITREQQIRLGYMPKRDDFEREYDNDAEFLVSKLAVNANDDTELDEELKIAHINMYTDKLRERFRRKRVVLEYNLVKLFFHMHSEENDDVKNDTCLQYKSAPSNNILDQSNSQCTYSSHSAQNTNTVSEVLPICHQRTTATSKVIEPATGTNHNKANNIPANSILNYFSKLDHSKNGDAKLQQSSKPQDGHEYSILSSYFSDLDKTIAEKDFNTMEEKLRIFCQFSSVEVHNQLIRNLAREKELKVKIKGLIKRRKLGYKKLNNNIKTSEVTSANSLDTSCKFSQPLKKNPTKDSPSYQVSMDIDNETTTLTPTKVAQKKNNSNNKNESTKTTTNIAYICDPANQSGWRLLTDGEKRLCKKSNLKPSQYISFKAFLLKENAQKKKKGASQRIFTGDIDKTVKRKIQDFLARNNWIKV